MTSQARTDANRENAKKSTGPISEDGKRASSRNALKHGLTARQAVLPHEDKAAFDDRVAAWVGRYGDADPLRQALAERAATASWRLDRCVRVEAAGLAKLARHAEADHDRLAKDRAEALGQRLIFEPICRVVTPETRDPITIARLEQRQDDDPPVLLREMESFPQGVDWLIARWRELDRHLDDFGFWHCTERFTALWLLGRRPEDAMTDEAVARIVMACFVLHPVPFGGLWDDFHQGRLGVVGKPMFLDHVEVLRDRLPATEQEALDELSAVAAGELARLEGLRARLAAAEAADRAGAADRAVAAGLAASGPLRRYETACERSFHKAVADLLKARKEPAPEESGWVGPAPAAADEPEAPAPAPVPPAPEFD